MAVIKINTSSLGKLKEELAKKEIHEGIAKLVRELVYRRIKSGKGVSSSGGSDAQLKELSDSYILYRKGIAQGMAQFIAKSKRVKFHTSRHKQLHASARPARSNLTLTGTLLDSIVYETTNGGFTLYIEEKTYPDTRKEKLTTKDVLEFVSKDRPFMFLTRAEVTRVEREYEKLIRSVARKLFGRGG